MRTVAETGFLGVATYLGYALWDTAMRQGNVVLVVTCFYLAVVPGPKLWVGCVILIAGSMLSWYSISDTSYS